MTDQDQKDEQELGQLLRSERLSFESGFSSRVMHRVEAEHNADLDLVVVMRQQFRRLAPLGLAASLALAAFNFARAGATSEQGAVDALFGLEPETIGYTYSIEIPGMEEPGVTP